MPERHLYLLIPSPKVLQSGEQAFADLPSDTRSNEKRLWEFAYET